jgi:hypothetical protein
MFTDKTYNCKYVHPVTQYVTLVIITKKCGTGFRNTGINKNAAPQLETGHVRETRYHSEIPVKIAIFSSLAGAERSTD